MPADAPASTFVIQVPDFARLSDEKLTEHLIWYDGPWHPQTRAAMQRFKPRSLDLNANWANETYLWSCPICKRRKVEIFRLTTAGDLKATLEWHHDHLGDFFKSQLAREWGREWTLGIADEHRHLERIVSSLIARFHPTLICSDCNEVDGRIKRAIPVDGAFSFSPLETARFITARPHSTHDLDAAAAAEIWQQVRADFEDRKKLASTLIEKLKSGGLKKERPSGAPRTRGGMDFFKLMVDIVPEPASTFIYNTLADLRFRSTSRPVSDGAPVRKRRHRIVVPTDADLEAIIGDGVATKKWKASPENWRCPACGRSKREVVRKSNAKAWYAAIFSHTECCVRPGIDSGDVTIPDHVDHHHTFFICGDCHAVMRELRRRTPDADIYKSYLTVDQLRDLVGATPHSPHEVDWKKAEFFAAENVKWISAMDEYWPEFRHAAFVKESLDRLQERLGISYDDTLVAFAEMTRSDYPAEWSLIEVVEHLRQTVERAATWAEHASSSFPSL